MNSSAATDVSDFAAFWELSAATTSTSWWHVLGYHWEFSPWMLSDHHEHLLATELSVHGRAKGKLKPAKVKPPKGYGRTLTQRHEFSGPHFR